MTSWETPSAVPRRRPREGDDRGVSPVVGMILILGVTTVGIVAVLYWGVPTIADMKSDAEFTAISNQFRDLNANVEDLTRGTPGETAKRWQPSFQQGGLSFEADQERWILGTDVASGHNWSVASLYDTDNNFTVANAVGNPSSGTDATIQVDAWAVDAGVEDPVTVSDAADCSSGDDDPMDDTTVNTGETQYLCLYQDGDQFEVSGTTLKLEISESGTVLARFYVMDVGRLHYVMTMGPSQRDAYHTNGAVVDGEPDDLVVQTDPPFGPPRDAGDSTRFFARMIEYEGQGSLGGSDADQVRILMSLYSTDILEDTGDVHSLKVWVDGDTSDAWYDYLGDDQTDYEFQRADPASVPEFLTYTDTFDLKIVHSVVELTVT